MGSYEGIFRTCAYIKIKRQYTTQDISTTSKIKSTPRSIDPCLLSTDTEHSAALKMSTSSSSSTNHELTDLEASQPKQTAVNFLPTHPSEHDREDNQPNHRGSRPLASLLQGLTLIPYMEISFAKATTPCGSWHGRSSSASFFPSLLSRSGVSTRMAPSTFSFQTTTLLPGLLCSSSLLASVLCGPSHFGV